VVGAIARRLPHGTTLLDTGEAVARQLERLLAAGNRLGGGHGRLTVATSGAPLQVTATVDRLWGAKLPVVHWEP
jgi:glutamate racemase